MMRLLLILFILPCVQTISFGQKVDEKFNGTFPYQNYLPKDYGGNPQIFQIIQDSRGIVYATNSKGILEYDGVSWNIIAINSNNNELNALSIVKDGQGVLHVGANGDYGALLPDKNGKMEFHSELVSTGLDSVGRIGQLFIEGQRTYLKSEGELIILGGEKITRIKATTEFKKMSHVNNEFLIMQKDQGLFRVKNNELEAVKGNAAISDFDVMAVENFGGKRLVFTAENGIYHFNSNDEFEKITDYDGYSVISTLLINENYLSLGTYSNGIIILDESLSVVNSLGSNKGLSDPSIKCQYIDFEGNLWCGTNMGLTKFEYQTPLLTYSKSSGLNSSVERIIRFNGRLIISAQDGIYQMNEIGEFEKLPGLERDCYGLEVIDYNGIKSLLVAELNAAYAFDKNFNITNIQEGGPYDFEISPLDPNDIIIVHYNGLGRVKQVNGKLIPENYITDFCDAEPFNMIIQDDGTIWIGTKQDLDGGVYKTHVNVFTDSTIGFQRFYEEEGIPAGPTYMFELENEIYAATDQGLYKYCDGKFVVENGLGINFSGTKKGVHRINMDQKDRIWMVLFDADNLYEIGYSEKIDGKYVWNNQKFIPHSKEIIHTIYHDEDNITWLGGPAGLLRYDDKVEVDYNKPFKTLIRSVKYGDSVLFGGTFFTDTISSNQPDNMVLELEFSSNRPIEFNFAAPSYFDEKSTLYSYYLDGHDDQWSSWSNRTIKEYYLSEGTYTFQVKAKNIYGNISEISTYKLVILPPWYRTAVVYILYIIVALFMVFITVRLSIRRIKQQNIKLEKIIKDRTKEIHEQKAEVERQKDITDKKNIEILDSINYAKRIQKAILPSDYVFETSLPNSFILYKPKDIVAGDFYWLETKGDKILFAAADCTGHGVPGAMVSVVCNNALNRSVREYGLDNPADILNKSREIVIQEFDKSDEDVNDGMDIAMCSLKLGTSATLGGQLQYAGANNALWIIRKGASEIESIKANKQPIGKFVRPTPFVSHQVELNEGDTIYIFSDGYVDQFGGEHEKKFKAKAFQSLLLSIQDQPIKEHKRILDDVFEKWRGQIEQIDDVCVIGVRV